MSYKVQSFGFSDVGLVRSNNEDEWTEISRIPFFVLADGMGGHQAGEVAAKLAVVHLSQVIDYRFPGSISNYSLEEITSSLRQAIRQTNTYVYELSQENENLKGMGTTLCCFLLHEETLILAHIGDSRIYRFRKGSLKPLTKDHSLRSELMDKGELSKEAAFTFPYKNIITRAIGTTPEVEADIATEHVEPEDIYFLCSDGLSDAVSEAEMESLLENASSMETATHALIDAAKEKGGNDNITIVMMKVTL